MMTRGNVVMSLGLNLTMLGVLWHMSLLDDMLRLAPPVEAESDSRQVVMSSDPPLSEDEVEPDADAAKQESADATDPAQFDEEADAAVDEPEAEPDAGGPLETEATTAQSLAGRAGERESGEAGPDDMATETHAEPDAAEAADRATESPSVETSTGLPSELAPVEPEERSESPEAEASDAPDEPVDEPTLRTLDEDLDGENDDHLPLADDPQADGRHLPGFAIGGLDRAAIDRLIRAKQAVAYFATDSANYLIDGPLDAPRRARLATRSHLQRYSPRALALRPDTERVVRNEVHAEFQPRPETLRGGVARLLISGELEGIIRRRQLEAIAAIDLSVDQVRATRGQLRWSEGRAVDFEIHAVLTVDGRQMGGPE